MGKIFGTNGIRGIINKDLTPEFALKIGKAVGTFFPEKSKILIGKDARAGGDMLIKSVEGGLLSVGLRVSDAGFVPTPAMQFTIKNSGYNGGIMVTGSHNPPEYNGIKVIDDNGAEISREKELIVENILSTNKFREVNWDSVISEVNIESNIISKYIEKILSFVDIEKIRKKKFNVLIDSANSVGSLSTPLIAERLGCKVHTINSNLNPFFSARMPEPSAVNLKETAAISKILNADISVAHDGDADRAVFIDSAGNVITGDRSGALLSYWLSVKNPITRKLVYTGVSSSPFIQEFLSKHNIKIEWLKVGSVGISHKLMKDGGLAGFEENGGFIFPEHQYVRDGGMSFALMLELMANEDIPSTKLFDKLPKYYTLKGSVEMHDSNVERIYEKIEEIYGSGKEVIKIDGIKIVDKDYWFIVRKSGTEPILRIFVEAKTEEKAKSLQEGIIKQIQLIRKYL